MWSMGCPKLRCCVFCVPRIVHLCLRKADQKLVIIKQIPVEQMTKEERQSAQNECQVLKLLNHPNVIEYYENFLEDKALMIAMEYAPAILCSSLPRAVIQTSLLQVVGTPCYISPELCEGKPYNQKSDIWALGCVLYELASLKRAFEAANLPALVLKIMSGTFAPISDRYSPELRQLVLSLLSLEPAQRPPLSHIMAQPLCIRALLNLHTDVGSVRIPRGPVRPAIPPPLSSVYAWGGGLSVPLRLPMLNTEVVQVSAGRTQKAGVTRSGRLILWEVRLAVGLFL
ncbi:hypothetical protein NN561_012573 [Cricetulus griseus]